MLLCSVHKERMAEIHSASLACCQLFSSLGRACKSVRSQFAQSKASLACRCELPRYIDMGSDTDAGGRIGLAANIIDSCCS